MAAAARDSRVLIGMDKSGGARVPVVVVMGRFARAAAFAYTLNGSPRRVSRGLPVIRSTDVLLVFTFISSRFFFFYSRLARFFCVFFSLFPPQVLHFFSERRISTFEIRDFRKAFVFLASSNKFLDL